MKFIPLEFDKPMTLKEILREHPKGMQYGYILKNHSLYPIFIDSKSDVLSFPPIINSNYIGKVETGVSDLFIEVTGTSMKHVMLAANIIAYALYDRSAVIESVSVEYPWKTERIGSTEKRSFSLLQTPYLFDEKISFEKEKIRNILGIELTDKEIKYYLEKMQYSAKITGKNIIAEIPPYRNDIMHAVDVIEDIAIAYGYGNFKGVEIKSHTTGKLKEMTRFSLLLRRIMIGMKFQEVLSPILSNTENLSAKMNAGKENIIEIENVMSESYSAVRPWVLPSLMNFLSRNLHVEYPQRIFELGECAVREEDNVFNKTKLSACISNSAAGYQDIASVVDGLLRETGITYELKPVTNASFIPGRCAEILCNGKKVGIIGEIHPKVLNNWQLEKPVAAMEINLTKLFGLIKWKV